MCCSKVNTVRAVTANQSVKQVRLIRQSSDTYVAFSNDDVDHAADDRDEIKHVPRVTEVILFRQTIRLLPVRPLNNNSYYR